MMIPSEDKRTVFGRSPNFRLEGAGGAGEKARAGESEKARAAGGVGNFFFVHTSGNKVATDALGAMLWAAMPGTAVEIGGRIAVSARADVSGRMLDEFLRLMVCAEIAVASTGRAGGAGAEEREECGGSAGPGDFKAFEAINKTADAEKPVAIPAAAFRYSQSLSGAFPELCSGESGDSGDPLDYAKSEGRAENQSAVPSRRAVSGDSAAQPRVSVVVVTLNGKAHIRECLASLRTQTFGPLDIHVVDNGSTDGTLEIVRNEFPEARLHALAKNLFYPGGVNYGIAATAGAYILVLNDDVELTPGFTAEMVRVMEDAPRAAAVVPMMKLFYLRGFINGIGNHVRTKGWGSDNFVGLVDIGQFAGLTEVPSACVSAALLRRAAIEAAGPFDAAYRAYYEDADWSFRMRRAGWTINAAPQALVYHKFSAFWKNMERKLKLAARNRLRFVLKNFDGRLRRAFLRSYLKEDLINILSLVKHGRKAEAWAYLRAYGSLILTLPDVLDKRAEARRTWSAGRAWRAAGSAGKEGREGKEGAAGGRERGAGGVAAGRKSGGPGSVEEILELNPEQWTGMNAENVPRLDAGIYFAYYARQFAKIEAAGAGAPTESRSES